MEDSHGLIKYECIFITFYATFGAVVRLTKYRVVEKAPWNFKDLVLGE
jgi:hypothetical protein